MKEVDYHSDHDAIPLHTKESPENIAYKQARFQDLSNILCESIIFTTHLDVGCGSGYLIRAMRKNNISSSGTEIGFMFHHGLFPEVAPFVYEKSIFELDQLSSTYDLVSAMEILEHLFAENFARNDLNNGILNVINRSNKFIFLTMPILTPSYCPWLDWKGRDPGTWCRILTRNEIPLHQDGTPVLGHVTLATEAWWRCKLESFGLRRMKDQEEHINEHLRAVEPGLLEWWHVFLYEK